LVAQVELLTPDTIRAGIAVSLSYVRTLPIDWAQSPIVQARQETYLSFIFDEAYWRTVPSLNNNIWPFERRSVSILFAQLCSEETVSKNWFSNHPGSPSCGNMQVLHPRPTLKSSDLALQSAHHQSHVYELLQGSTDWLKAVSNDPSKLAAAALSANIETYPTTQLRKNVLKLLQGGRWPQKSGRARSFRIR
jgi:hypothetical protein